MLRLMSKKAAPAKKVEEEEEDSGSELDVEEFDSDEEENEAMANDLKRGVVVSKVFIAAPPKRPPRVHWPR